MVSQRPQSPAALTEKSTGLPPHPDATATGIRNAWRSLRRAELARVVRGVVVVSVLVCVAALARVAVAKASDEPPFVTHGARVSLMKGSEVMASFRTVHDDELPRPARLHPAKGHARTVRRVTH
jgi:hypothetical protein